MENTFTIKGKSAVKGVVEGEALVSRSRISFTGGMDPETGIIIEKGHELEGKKVTGKILIFPSGKGSVGASTALYLMNKRGTLPKAIVNIELDPPLVFGALMIKLPLIYEVPKDIFGKIGSGDYIKVDANKGIIEVNKRKQ
jgi:predicted aconitase with swiveling domain